VHNGIIENYRELREKLEAEGIDPSSETDSELIAHLIELGVTAGLDLLSAAREASSRLIGSYAFAAVCEREPNRRSQVRRNLHRQIHR
jgi:glucosamine--fructose-6-phosphate aminotransferase (isomerizing)